MSTPRRQDEYRKLGVLSRTCHAQIAKHVRVVRAAVDPRRPKPGPGRGQAEPAAAVRLERARLAAEVGRVDVVGRLFICK